MTSAVAWNGETVTVPEVLAQAAVFRQARRERPAVGRAQTIVPVRGEHASGECCLEHALANAVQAAVGDPAAHVEVDPLWTTVVQWYGGIEAAWHAETPGEWADAIEAAPAAADDAIAAGDLDNAMTLGLLDNVLDWREGWPPDDDEG